jgi:hypothetical protein
MRSSGQTVVWHCSGINRCGTNRRLEENWPRSIGPGRLSFMASGRGSQVSRDRLGRQAGPEVAGHFGSFTECSYRAQDYSVGKYLELVQSLRNTLHSLSVDVSTS